MSEGSEVGGCGARGEGLAAGRGTGDASAGERKGCGVIAAGLGVLAGSAFSIRFDFGVGSSGSDFFLGEGDLSASEVFLLAGVAVALAFGFGVTSSSSSPDFLPCDFDAFGFGVGDAFSSSSPPGVFFAFGVFVGSGVSLGLAFALGFGVGVGVAFFFVFDFRLAGFGFAVGSGVSDGVGEVTARISSRAFFFFSGSVDWAWTNAPRTAASAKPVPRKTRSRITGGERNRAEGVINSRKLSDQAGCGTASGARAAAARSRSRRRIAFSFPPSSRSKQVRYIQVIRTIMEASAR